MAHGRAKAAPGAANKTAVILGAGLVSGRALVKTPAEDLHCPYGFIERSLFICRLLSSPFSFVLHTHVLWPLLVLG